MYRPKPYLLILKPASAFVLYVNEIGNQSYFTLIDKKRIIHFPAFGFFLLPFRLNMSRVHHLKRFININRVVVYQYQAVLNE